MGGFGFLWVCILWHSRQIALRGTDIHSNGQHNIVVARSRQKPPGSRIIETNCYGGFTDVIWLQEDQSMKINN